MDNDGSDLDLHFRNPNGDWQTIWDCNASNTNPDWGIAGSENNPSLDISDNDGNGPENIRHLEPEDLVYRVGVDYKNANGYGASHATVAIFVNGSLVYHKQNVTLSATGYSWEVADITWPGRSYYRTTLLWCSLRNFNIATCRVNLIHS